MSFLIGATAILLGLGAIGLAWNDKVSDAWHILAH